jgi:alpha-D-ribose 1-methylphosphonate 5-triphosphate synthase subunit PhnH
LAIVGAIIDYPELASEAAIQASVTALDSDEVLTLAAALNGNAPPPSLQDWVNERMVAPEFESVAEARQSVIENAETMRRLEQVKRRRALMMGAA